VTVCLVLFHFTLRPSPCTPSQWMSVNPHVIQCYCFGSWPGPYVPQNAPPLARRGSGPVRWRTGRVLPSMINSFGNGGCDSTRVEIVTPASRPPAKSRRRHGVGWSWRGEPGQSAMVLGALKGMGRGEIAPSWWRHEPLTRWTSTHWVNAIEPGRTPPCTNSPTPEK